MKYFSHSTVKVYADKIALKKYYKHIQKFIRIKHLYRALHENIGFGQPLVIVLGIGYKYFIDVKIFKGICCT